MELKSLISKIEKNKNCGIYVETSDYDNDIKKAINKILNNYIINIENLIIKMSYYLPYNIIESILIDELNKMTNYDLYSLILGQYSDDIFIKSIDNISDDVIRKVFINQLKENFLSNIPKNNYMYDEEKIIEYKRTLNCDIEIFKRINNVKESLETNYKICVKDDAKNKYHGEYIVNDNMLVLNDISCLYNKLFKLISSSYDEDKKIEYSGFEIKDKDEIGIGFNEGYTSFLSEVNFKEKNDEVSKILKKYVYRLTNMLSNHVMEKYYFTNDLEGLYSYIENKYGFSKQKMKNFINGLDYIYYYGYINKSKYKIDKKLKKQLKMYINALISDLDNTLDELSILIYNSNVKYKVLKNY